MTTSQKTRISMGTFDLIKGIGIIAIIFAHIHIRYNSEHIPFLDILVSVLKYLGYGLMPMFFIISGFGFKNKPVKKMLKKTLSEMMIPYLWVSVACVVGYIALRYPFYEPKSMLFQHAIERVIGFALGVSSSKDLWGYSLKTVQAMWFILALFIALNLLNVIVKIKNRVAQFLLISLCVVSGYILQRLDFTYYCLPQGLMAVGFCFVGYLIKQYKLFDWMISNIGMYVILGLIFVCMAVWGNFDMANGGFNLLEYLGAGCVGVLFTLLGILTSRFEMSGLTWLRRIGISSYWIICLHSVEMSSVPWPMLVEALPQQFMYIAFIAEIVIRAFYLFIGCYVLRKISIWKYRKRIASNGK